MFKRLIIGGLALAIASSVPSSASGSNPNSFTVTLHCEDGRTLTGRSIEQNSGKPFIIEETTGVLVQMEGSYVDLDDPAAPAVVFQEAPSPHLPLLTCVYDTVYFGAKLRVTAGFLDNTH